MKINCLKAGSISCAFAVLLGAFGAHALKNQLPESSIEIYKTASQYHFIHSLALILIGLMSERLQEFGQSQLRDKDVFKTFQKNKKLHQAGLFFLFGLILFSGSLYLLAVSQLKFLGIITPFGGVSFILGWLFLFRAANKKV